MQNRIQKTTKTILFIALGMQIIYMLSVVLITTMPQKLLILFGCSGNFDMPFDFYSFTYAAGCTILFLVFFFVLLHRIASQKSVGNRFGVWLGIYTYGLYFVANDIVGTMRAMWANDWIDSRAAEDFLTATLGENVAGANYISVCCGWAKIWFFTALVLLMIAYSLYRFYGKTQKE